MLTGDTITDEQIIKLRSDVLAGADTHERFEGHSVAASCSEALGEVHLHGSTRAGARDRCADYLNHLAAKS